MFHMTLHMTIAVIVALYVAILALHPMPVQRARTGKLPRGADGPRHASRR
jgi:hypothetical protein